MNIRGIIASKAKDTIAIYWVLLKITVPIAIITEILSRLGVIKAVAPVFAPVMSLVGLPPELGLAWLTAMLVGIWGAVPLIFTLVPVSSLSVADVTIFSSLILFAHALPIEQKIIEKAGPGIPATTFLRVGGGLLYALVLHQVFAATGWMSAPVNPTWIPIAATPDWASYLWGLGETMVWMFVILFALTIALDLLKISGILAATMKLLSPLLRLAGIRGEAGHLTAVGLFLGISYGGGLLIREAQSGHVSPRQVFLACVFMGFAHSVIEDTLIVMSVGADVWGVLIGRVIFAIAATAMIAALLSRMSDERFFKRFHRGSGAAPAE